MNDLEYGLEGLKLTGSLLLLLMGIRAMRAAVLADWRQTLFEIRNDLWDKMKATGYLDARGHRELRDSINGTIRLGRDLNLFILIATWYITPKELRQKDTEWVEPEKMGIPPGPAMEAILRAQSLFTNAILRRVLFDTLPGALVGWPLWCVWRTIHWLARGRIGIERPVAGLKARFRTIIVETERVAMENERAAEQDRALASC